MSIACMLDLQGMLLAFTLSIGRRHLRDIIGVQEDAIANTVFNERINYGASDSVDSVGQRARETVEADRCFGFCARGSSEPEAGSDDGHYPFQRHQMSSVHRWQHMCSGLMRLGERGRAKLHVTQESSLDYKNRRRVSG